MAEEAAQGANLTINEALVSALRKSKSGLALFEEREGVRYLAWASPSFYLMFDMKTSSTAGRPSDGWATKQFGQAAFDILFSRTGGSCKALKGDLCWELESLALPGPAGQAAKWTALWTYDQTARRKAEAERDDLAKRLVDERALDDDSGFFGPKAFWKAVGAGWALAARTGTPVALGFFTVRNAPGHERSPSELEPFAAAALGATFKRTSDLIAKLSENSFAVFVAGQGHAEMAGRFDRFRTGLSSVCVGFAGLSGCSPKKSSSPKDVKVCAKKALMAAMKESAGGSATSLPETE